MLSWTNNYENSLFKHRQLQRTPRLVFQPGSVRDRLSGARNRLCHSDQSISLAILALKLMTVATVHSLLVIGQLCGQILEACKACES
ncbi:hypothetical protein VDGL01_06942 [Verticillium dahliae]